MLIPLFFLIQSITPVSDNPLPTLNEIQFEECIILARKDPPSAVIEASLWAQQKGDYLATACHALALANDFRFAEAAPLFIDAAQGADAKADRRGARFWAQAGNAAIAADLPNDALAALDNALRPNSLDNAERADIEVDRARSLVALAREIDAAAALANARRYSPENATAWLLSATLARRMNILPDALGYIQTAATLSPRDPAVALEAGNIAAAAGDDASARKQWEQVIIIAPDSRQATTAQKQLAALGGTNTSPVADAQSR
jgi:tetratricopeptide (TPR) repeat protein